MFDSVRSRRARPDRESPRKTLNTTCEPSGLNDAHLYPPAGAARLQAAAHQPRPVATVRPRDTHPAALVAPGHHDSAAVRRVVHRIRPPASARSAAAVCHPDGWSGTRRRATTCTRSGRSPPGTQRPRPPQAVSSQPTLRRIHRAALAQSELAPRSSTAAECRTATVGRQPPRPRLNANAPCSVHAVVFARAPPPIAWQEQPATQATSVAMRDMEQSGQGPCRVSRASSDAAACERRW